MSSGLPPIHSSNSNSKSNVFKPDLLERIPPPDFDVSRGVNNITRLRTYTENLYESYQRNIAIIIERNHENHHLNEINLNLSDNLKQKISLLTALKNEAEIRNREDRTLAEIERQLLLEKKIRLGCEKKLALVEIHLENEKLEFSKYKATVLDNSRIILEQKANTVILQNEKKALEAEIDSNQFTIGGLKVESIKFERLNGTLTKENKELTAKIKLLTDCNETLSLENGQLQKKIRELIDANKEVTINYQIVKKNYDLKKVEAQELAKETEEATEACQLALKQKKAAKEELFNALKKKADLEAAVKKEQEDATSHKETIQDLIKRITEMETEHEEQINKKEQQIQGAAKQRLEEVRKLEQEKLRAINSANRKREEAAALSAAAAQESIQNLVASVDDVESPPASQANEEGDIQSIQLKIKFKKIQKNLLKEIAEFSNTIKERNNTIKSLTENVSRLENSQFEPRMIHLQSIERIMKEKLLEFSISDERLAIGFTCPKDLKVLDNPVTFSKCGHTFCSSCADEIKQENFSVLKCSVCKTVSDCLFKNGKLENIKNEFFERKSNMHIFNEWLITLESHKPIIQH